MKLNRLFVILALMISILVLPGILKDVYAGGFPSPCNASECTSNGESACTDKGSCSSGTGAQCEWCGTFCADVCPTPTGACCNCIGSCSASCTGGSTGVCGDPITQSSCESMGGTYQGDGTSCSPSDPCPTPTPTPVPFVNCSFVPNLCLCQGRGKNLFEIDCDDTEAIEDCEKTRGKKPGRVLYLIEDDASKFDIDCECDCNGGMT